MPIRPENKKYYGKEWQKISKYIREERANNKCENCEVENHSIGYRDNKGIFHKYTVDICNADFIPDKLIKIVLTVAHLDHNPKNNNYHNLKALCQKCHNSYDMPVRAANRRKRIEIKKGQLKLV